MKNSQIVLQTRKINKFCKANVLLSLKKNSLSFKHIRAKFLEQLIISGVHLNLSSKYSIGVEELNVNTPRITDHESVF
jgi:hypothetical protein